MSTLSKDQLLILIQREVIEDASKVSEFKKLAGELLEDMRRRGYIGELKKLKTNKDAIGMVELLQRLQKDDMEKVARLLLMANETKLKMCDKNSFILKIRGLLMGSYVNEAMCMSMVFLSNWVDMDVVVNANMKDSLKVADMTSDGVLTKFSVNKVWKELKKNEEQVDWYKSVWFSHCIPSHAFILCEGVNSVPLHDLEAASPPSGSKSPHFLLLVVGIMTRRSKKSGQAVLEG
nr:reverse transcriptase domain, reverse transcriptase zinc-binding domain protein [Tanacetum cinerariifolium]